MAFKKGDIVELKSGGPDMTVKSVEGDGDVLAVWYQDGKMNSFIFNQEMLKPKGNREARSY